jgi:hypothetical protein
VDTNDGLYQVFATAAVAGTYGVVVVSVTPSADTPGEIGNVVVEQTV